MHKMYGILVSFFFGVNLVVIVAGTRVGLYSESFVNYHNSKPGVTWKASIDYLKHIPEQNRHDFVRRMCGVKTSGNKSKLPRRSAVSSVYQNIPEEFDSRSQWPECESLQEIRDQGACGSCYAVSTTEAATDRLCIRSEGKIKAHLSEQQVLSCCQGCGDGCDGGFPQNVWDYLQTDGVVTGGQWRSNEGCYPYEVRACDRKTIIVLGPCGNIEAPECKTECRPGYNVSYDQDRHFAQEVYSVRDGEKAIQAEIMSHGPVVGTMKVFEDFPLYKSGIYQATSSDYVGRHAIKIIGWGVDDGVPYWLCANSWNTEWGIGGFFKILRGSNECTIENDISAGIMKVD